VPMPISAPNLHFDDPLHEAQQPRVTTSATYLAEHMAEVPALVVPCITPRVDGLPMWIQACLWGSVLSRAWGFMLGHAVGQAQTSSCVRTARGARLPWLWRGQELVNGCCGGLLRKME
jgi:hypothetical protein